MVKLLIVFCFTFAVSAKALEFDYTHQAKWYDQFPDCSRDHQSPIELNTNEAQVSYDMPELIFEHYNVQLQSPTLIENNGHSVNIVLPKSSDYQKNQLSAKRPPSIRGGPLPEGRYVTDSVHFHWGSKNNHGSEHVIDSVRFAMEMHILHRNIKYQNVEEARNEKDGLVVLAVPYAVNGTFGEDFLGLRNIVNALKTVKEYEKTAIINNFVLSELLGNLNVAEFYSYEGSLTTPPCSELVSWIVFSHPVEISPEQMSHFHELYDKEGTNMDNNYRALQSKGNRKVLLRLKRKVIDSVIEGPGFWELLNNTTKQNN